MEIGKHTAGALRVREFLATSSDLSADATRDISVALTALLADVFALYIKTKNFQAHERAEFSRISFAA
jgi:hypothetical protein